MESVLNRGFNFAILPLNLDITQVLVDYKRFERTMIWQEFWYGRVENVETKPVPIFKLQKFNLPKNHKTPDELKTFLEAVKLDLTDPINRKKVKSNLPPQEMKALKELIQLQKEKKITIKPCDKGAGIIILNFEEYLRACYTHLESTQKQPDGTETPYYKKVSEAEFEEAQIKLNLLLEEGFNNRYITKEEFEAMKTDEKHFGKFYCTFKVHKPHTINKAPPERPIISGSGSLTENPSLFVEHFIKDLAKQHNTYLQDTPDFLRQIELINEGQELPENAHLVTVDVSGLFTNIPQDERAQAVEESLNERDVKNVPTEFIVRILELIQENNIFEFNSELYSQKIGGAMGQRHVPSEANIFLARRIDIMIELIARTNYSDSLKFIKRFLDDLFLIFCGSTKQLHNFIEEINQIHPNIKFTMTHTTLDYEPFPARCSCPPQKSIQFLDTSCTIREGRIFIFTR